MEAIVLFVFTYLFTFIFYEFFIVRSAKRNTKKKKKTNKDPFEMSYLKDLYHTDLSKIPYNQLLRVISLVSSFDIALVVSIVVLIKNTIIQLLVGVLLIAFFIVFSYHLVYLFYKKKGMIGNE